MTQSSPCSRNALHRRGDLGDRPLEHVEVAPLGEVEVLLRARQRELLADDRLVEHEPRVVETAVPQVVQRAERVEAGEEGSGQAVPGAVEPHRARPRQDADRVPRPDGVPVAHALDVVPHPVAVDDRAAGRLGDRQHPAVDVGRHAGEQVVRRRAEAVGPVGPHEVVVPADAARRDDDRLAAVLEVPGDVAVARDPAGRGVGSEQGSAHPRDHTAGVHELVDPVARAVEHAARGDVLAHPLLEGGDDPAARAPGDVEARYGVPVSATRAVTALGPAHDGEEGDAALAQPRPLAAGGPLDVGAAPLPAPVVGARAAVGIGQAVPAGGALPVLPGEVERVGDAHPPLLRAVDEEEPTEAPPRLAAEVGLALLVEEDDGPAGLGELARGDEAGEPGSHDDDVGIHGPTLCPGQPRSTSPGADREVADVRDDEVGHRVELLARGVPRTATSARHPASRAARSPATESSTTTHSPGSTPSRRAPSSHGSGHGLPRATSDAVTTTGGCGRRVAAMRASARSRVPDVTIAVGTAPAARVPSRSAAPGSTTMPSTSATSRSRMRSKAASRSFLGEQLGDDAGRGHAVETPEPQRVHPELAAPPQPRALDGRDRVDERAVHVEEHAGEGLVERRGCGVAERGAGRNGRRGTACGPA